MTAGPEWPPTPVVKHVGCAGRSALESRRGPRAPGGGRGRSAGRTPPSYPVVGVGSRGYTGQRTGDVWLLVPPHRRTRRHRLRSVTIRYAYPYIPEPAYSGLNSAVRYSGT